MDTSQPFDEWLDSQQNTEVGRQYLRCRDRMARHHYPTQRKVNFPEKVQLNIVDRSIVEKAVDEQLQRSHAIILWMVWKLTPDEVKKAAGIPIRENAFLKSIDRSESAARQWRKTYGWMDDWLFMAARTGKDILKSVEDDLLREIGENALNRENDKQLGWMKVAVEVTGLKAPTITKNYEVNVDDLTDDELDRLASGEDPKKVLQ